MESRFLFDIFCRWEVFARDKTPQITRFWFAKEGGEIRWLETWKRKRRDCSLHRSKPRSAGRHSVPQARTSSGGGWGVKCGGGWGVVGVSGGLGGCVGVDDCCVIKVMMICTVGIDRGGGSDPYIFLILIALQICDVSSFSTQNYIPRGHHSFISVQSMDPFSRSRYRPTWKAALSTFTL